MNTSNIYRAGAPIAALLLSASLTALAPMALAQEADGDVFTAESFVGAAPVTALDMVQRLPAFAIVEADEDVRGYSGAQGNVLIDGARPASKRDNVNELLRRIPAGSVERIELIRSSRPGVDMAGFAVVANVIRRADASTEAAIEVGGVAAEGWAAPAAKVEYGRRWGERALELAAFYQPELDDDSGEGWIRETGPEGDLLEDARLNTFRAQESAEATASWRQPLAGGRLTANAAARADRSDERTRIDTQGPEPGREDVSEREDLIEGELGARYVRRLGERTTVEAVASQRVSRLEALSVSDEDGDSERFSEDTDTGESIGRLEVTHEWSDRLTVSASIEGAFNFLESRAELVEDGEPVALPGSDVRIEERRGEAAIGGVWRPISGWTVEAGVRVEASAIAQTGDTPLERDFTYLKPRLAAAWDVNDFNQLRLGISREVGQLDFGDFVASASLQTGQVSVGNAALEPDKIWRLTAAWERRFGEDASLTLGWTHDEITDVVDRVLVIADDGVFDAPGNIGDGRRDTLSAELSTPLDRLGVHGGHLSASLAWTWSEVTDPVTGEARPISEEKPFEGSIGFTQDVPSQRLSWGFTIEHIAERETKYRFDEIAAKSEATGWTLFVERRLGDHWRVRAEATDLFGRRFEETREKYDGPRSTAPLEAIERRERESPGFVSVMFRRSMGG